jgi:ankyrin repeat protein
MLAGVLETLVEAVAAGDAKAVATMLENGVPPDSRHDGTTALYTAAVAGDESLVELLLRAGADPNLLSAGPGGEGTPLCAAACWGYVDVLRSLLAHGADPDQAEDEWWTPLRWAAAHGHESAARVLLDAGANPDLKAPIGDATRRGSVGVVKALLEHGADPDETDAEGQTALELAEWWSGKDVEAELVARVDLLVGTLEHGRRGADLSTARTQLPDGTELVSVQATFPDGSATGSEVQTGHARIAALLRARRRAA